MGICASCLGGRNRDAVDEDDESRLLFDDPSGIHYGSFDDQQMNGPGDPVETQREIEALQRVVARTSDNLVDIFEITPQENALRTASNPFALAGQEARQMRYQNLLSRLSADDDVVGGAKVDWLNAEDDDIEMNGEVPPLKAEIGEPLVGNFTDAAAAAMAYQTLSTEYLDQTTTS